MNRRNFLAGAAGAGIGVASTEVMGRALTADASSGPDARYPVPASSAKVATPNKRVTLSDGDHVEYQVFGDKGPFIFMGPHCYLTPPKMGSGDERMTGEYVKGLSDRYRVIVADWPRGFGNSSPAKPKTMVRDTMIRDIHAIADAAGADRFAWWGYSFGGAVALQVARKNKRISAVVCGGWPPLWQPISDLLNSLHVQARRQRAENPTGLSGFEHQMILGSIAFYESISGQDDWTAIREIECPRLVLHDQEDALAAGERGYPQPLDLGQRTRASEKELKSLGWEVAWIKTGRGHLAMIDTKTMLGAFAPFFDRVLLGRK